MGSDIAGEETASPILRSSGPNIRTAGKLKAQIPLGSTRLDSTRSTLSSQSSQSSKSRRACRARQAGLFQHGGLRTILYKFSRFYALAYTNPICFIK